MTLVVEVRNRFGPPIQCDFFPASAQEDLSNISTVAKELGWEQLWAKPGQSGLGNQFALPEYSSVKWTFD